MTDEEQELVEMIAKVMPNTIPYGKCLAISEVIIPVVKANISKIAKICPCVYGDYHGEVSIIKECKTCNGTGIVPKGKQ